MAYVGNQPVPQATQTRDRFVATSGQTSFATSGYTPNFVDVYLDGVKLDSSEYTATNGSDVVLASGASTGQIMEVVAFSSFDVADIRNMTQPLGLKNYTTTERNALTGIGAGDTIFNSTVGSIQFYDGANWISTNLIPLINSITGTIYAGAASTLTLSLTNATDTIDVRYYEGGTLLATDAGVTVTSGSVTSTVPATVYGQTAGDTISVQVINQDGTPSSNSISKTVQGTPTGGTITTSGAYRIHTFTSSSSFVVPSGLSLSDVEYVVVAGGGAGGGSNSSTHYGGGGGGAGGYRSSVPGENSGRNSSAETRLSLTAGSYTVTIGAGGASRTNKGSNSVFSTITSLGGGYGGEQQGGVPPTSGGSGGGAGRDGGDGGSEATGASGTTGQGFQGGNSTDAGCQGAGGGGGAGQAGFAGTDDCQNYDPSWTYGQGGAGIASSIRGTSEYRAGGGGGDWWGSGSTNDNRPQGGSGGGGHGANANRGVPATNGASNSGGGGGGGDGRVSNSYNGSGGSGIVVVRYQL